MWVRKMVSKVLRLVGYTNVVTFGSTKPADFYQIGGLDPVPNDHRGLEALRIYGRFMKEGFVIFDSQGNPVAPFDPRGKTVEDVTEEWESYFRGDRPND